MRKGVIYKITSPTGKVYIGKTVNFSSRMSCYRRNHTPGQHLLGASITKYGWEAHSVEILKEAEADKLNDLEIGYIKQFNSFSRKNPTGLNLTEGGEGSLGRKDTEEVKERRASSHRGKTRSEETKKLMSNAKKGKVPKASLLPRSEKQLLAWKLKNVGQKRSEEQIQKQLQTKLQKFSERHGCILQYDKNGTLIREWFMLPCQVAKEVNIDSSHFSQAVKKGDKMCAGYYWKFKF